ncbi:hypothetical protein K439DRAFT_1620780 [Ramaria rubella]|nr:hypothetical protein K439DRAFT_1620780 [Ramaria rubella]
MPWQKTPLPAVPPSNLVCLSPHPTLPPPLSPSNPPPLPSSAALHSTPPPFPDALLDPEYPTSEDKPNTPLPHRPRSIPQNSPHPPHPTSVPSPRPPPPPQTPPPQCSATPSDILPREQRSPVTIKPPPPARHLHRLSCTPSGPVDRANPPAFAFLPLTSILRPPNDLPRSWRSATFCGAIEHDPAASLMDRLLGDYRSLLSFASLSICVLTSSNPRNPVTKPSELSHMLAQLTPTSPHSPVKQSHLTWTLSLASNPCTILGAPERPGPRPPPPSNVPPGTPPLSLPEHSALVMLLASTRPEVQTALAAAVHKDEYSQPENTVRLIAQSLRGVRRMKSATTSTAGWLLDHLASTCTGMTKPGRTRTRP